MAELYHVLTQTELDRKLLDHTALLSAKLNTALLGIDNLTAEVKRVSDEEHKQRQFWLDDSHRLLDKIDKLQFALERIASEDCDCCSCGATDIAKEALEI